MTDLVPVRRALLSVSDKTDLVPFARSLLSYGVELISTGGTASVLSEAGLDVTPIEKVTGFPEILGGRVKTLHPGVHAALLAMRDQEDHQRALDEHSIEPIDLVCINLYPFEQTATTPDATEAQIIEQIDIGGPAMIRSAAKNAAWVTVVTSASDYDRVVSELADNDGATTYRMRASLAAAAFSRTSAYDATISAYLGRVSPVAFPPKLRPTFTKIDDLRYGENPHQAAAWYRDPVSMGPTVVNAEQLAGKHLSYNNVADASAALEVVKALRKLDRDRTGACVVKHTNPCGAAIAQDAAAAILGAVAGDPIAAYGGILAVNQPIDRAAAEALTADAHFFEVILAPSIDETARAALTSRWGSVRLLAVGDKPGSTNRKLEYRSIPGGMLVQDRDTRGASPDDWSHRAGPRPSDEQLDASAFVETICRFVASNAIVVGGHEGDCVRVFGTGAGQMDRVGACRIAVGKAGDRAAGAIAASDAFFPFPDGPEVLIDAGVTTLVHPGGSKRDQETFSLCDQRGVSCLTTGVRHFRH